MDQVTHTKSGTQSGLFTDCFTDNITGLKCNHRTDPLGCLNQAGVPWCHTVKLFHSKNIGFETIFLHYHYFLRTYKNQNSKLFNILGMQHKHQMKG